jgi:hypothetical protein
MPYIILIPAHGLGKFISYLGVCHWITKTHLGGQDTLQSPPFWWLMTTHLSHIRYKQWMLKAFVILPFNMCILILNINGPIRANILHNKRNKRVLQQWGACDVQQMKVRCSWHIMHLKRKKENSGAERSGVSGQGPECPENPETPRKSPDSPGFSTAEEKQTSHSFQSSINCP